METMAPRSLLGSGHNATRTILSSKPSHCEANRMAFVPYSILCSVSKCEEPGHARASFMFPGKAANDWMLLLELTDKRQILTISFCYLPRNMASRGLGRPIAAARIC
jgi:hypothetical protein